MSFIKTIFFYFFLFFIFSAEASHILGGDIQVNHIQGNDYEIKLTLIGDWGIAGPPNYIPIQSYQREGVILMETFNLFLDSFYLIQSSNPACGPNPINYEVYDFRDTVNLSDSIYNDPGGYYITFSQCCKTAGIFNILNPSSAGQRIVTLIPPVVDSLGSAIINHSPQLLFPARDIAIRRHNFSLDFGGFDPDGDSLAYELYTPFEDDLPVPGSASPITQPYSDPTTQFSGINWAAGYNVDDQIHGFPGPNPSPNRLKVNANTGVLTMVPEFAGSGFFNFGIWCKEYRNGQLIGSVFRDFVLTAISTPLVPIQNNPPTISLALNQPSTYWHVDTVELSASPICIQFKITDPDVKADIQILAEYSDYEYDDIYLLQNNATILNTDTFVTSLCFNPDTFFTNPSSAQIVVLNPGCYNLKGDTLPFYFKFVGYSNAGWGGTKTIPMATLNGTIDLFNILTKNPLPGGIWYDLDGNNHMTPNGFLEWKYITTPKTYRLIYVQQEPNHTPDTAYLTLNFVYPNSIEDHYKTTIEVFPNPANRVLTISGIIEASNFEIFDIQGRKVRSALLSPERNTVNTADLKEGLYFFQYNNQRGKFLIQR
ncbi:MAG: T9SS type A sorting domain-containing protein [Cytophagales bacterium]